MASHDRMGNIIDNASDAATPAPIEHLNTAVLRASKPTDGSHVMAEWGSTVAEAGIKAGALLAQMPDLAVRASQSAATGNRLAEWAYTVADAGAKASKGTANMGVRVWGPDAEEIPTHTTQGNDGSFTTRFAKQTLRHEKWNIVSRMPNEKGKMYADVRIALEGTPESGKIKELLGVSAEGATMTDVQVETDEKGNQTLVIGTMSVEHADLVKLDFVIRRTDGELSRITIPLRVFEGS